MCLGVLVLCLVCLPAFCQAGLAYVDANGPALPGSLHQSTFDESTSFGTVVASSANIAALNTDVLTRIEALLTPRPDGLSEGLAAVVPSGLNVTYGEVSGVLTLSAFPSHSASAALFEQALRDLQYYNFKDEPDGVDRYVQFTVFSGTTAASATGGPKTFAALSIVRVDDAPRLDLNANDNLELGAIHAADPRYNAISFTEHGPAVPLAPAGLVTDDNSAVRALNFTFEANSRASGDQILVADDLIMTIPNRTVMGNSTIIWFDPVVSSAAATLVLRSIRFNNTAGEPGARPRRLVATATDAAGGVSEVARVGIGLITVNDHAPVFSAGADGYFFMVSENDAQLVIGQVQARDEDQTAAGPDVITYQLVNVSAQVEAAVRLDAVTGQLSLKTRLDREAVDALRFTVSARDTASPPHTSLVPVTIYVLDENDNAPELPVDDIVLFVAENTALDTTVGRVLATDRDSGRNARLAYSLLPDPTSSVASMPLPLRIDASTGSLIVNDTIDYELRANYTAQIVVTDGGVPCTAGGLLQFSPCRTTTTLILVVRNQDDVVPTIMLVPAQQALPDLPRNTTRNLVWLAGLLVTDGDDLGYVSQAGVRLTGPAVGLTNSLDADLTPWARDRFGQCPSASRNNAYWTDVQVAESTQEACGLLSPPTALFESDTEFPISVEPTAVVATPRVDVVEQWLAGDTVFLAFFLSLREPAGLEMQTLPLVTVMPASAGQPSLQAFLRADAVVVSTQRADDALFPDVRLTFDLPINLAHEPWRRYHVVLAISRTSMYVYLDALNLGPARVVSANDSGEETTLEGHALPAPFRLNSGASITFGGGLSADTANRGPFANISYVQIWRSADLSRLACWLGCGLALPAGFQELGPRLRAARTYRQLVFLPPGNAADQLLLTSELGNGLTAAAVGVLAWSLDEPPTVATEAQLQMLPYVTDATGSVPGVPLPLSYSHALDNVPQIVDIGNPDALTFLEDGAAVPVTRDVGTASPQWDSVVLRLVSRPDNIEEELSLSADAADLALLNGITLYWLGNAALRLNNTARDTAILVAEGQGAVQLAPSPRVRDTDSSALPWLNLTLHGPLDALPDGTPAEGLQLPHPLPIGLVLGTTNHVAGAAGQHHVHLRGPALASTWMLLLSQVAYLHASDGNTTSGVRRITVVVADDGEAVSEMATAYVAFTATNNAPLIALSSTGAVNSSISFVEGDVARVVCPDAVLQDLDSTDLLHLELVLLDAYDDSAEGLSLARLNDELQTAFLDGGQRITVSGRASVSSYQAILRSLSYYNLAVEPFPAMRRINVFVQDANSLAPANASALAFVSVTTSNDNPPELVASPASPRLPEGLAAGSEAFSVIVEDLDLAGPPPNITHVRFAPSYLSVAFNITTTFSLARARAPHPQPALKTNFCVSANLIRCVIKAAPRAELTFVASPQAITLIDRELLADFEVTVGAHDDDFSASLTLTVQVDGINEFSPLYAEDNITVYVSEDMPAGSVLATLQATDGDRPDQQLRYALGASTWNELPSLLAIDASTGAIHMLQALDAEILPSEIRFVVWVNETAGPEPWRSTPAHVRLVLRDINEFAPTFVSGLDARVVIVENNAVGALLHEFVVEDADRQVPNNEVHVELLDAAGRPNPAFAHELQYLPGEGPGSGARYRLLLFANQSFDYDDTAAVNGLSLVIRLRDGGNLTHAAAIRLVIVDANDNAPQARLEEALTEVPEDLPIGSAVARVTAADLDGPNFNRFSWSVAPAPLFLMSARENGAILLGQGLDAETAQAHQVVVTAVDNLNANLRTSVSFVLTVTDVNDNAPEVRLNNSAPKLKAVPATWAPQSLSWLRVVDADVTATTNHVTGVWHQVFESDWVATCIPPCVNADDDEDTAGPAYDLLSLMRFERGLTPPNNDTVPVNFDGIGLGVLVGLAPPTGTLPYLSEFGVLSMVVTVRVAANAPRPLALISKGSPQNSTVFYGLEVEADAVVFHATTSEHGPVSVFFALALPAETWYTLTLTVDLDRTVALLARDSHGIELNVPVQRWVVNGTTQSPSQGLASPAKTAVPLPSSLVDSNGLVYVGARVAAGGPQALLQGALAGLELSTSSLALGELGCLASCQRASLAPSVSVAASLPFALAPGDPAPQAQPGFAQVAVAARCSNSTVWAQHAALVCGAEAAMLHGGTSRLSSRQLTRVADFTPVLLPGPDTLILAGWFWLDPHAANATVSLWTVAPSNTTAWRLAFAPAHPAGSAHAPTSYRLVLEYKGGVEHSQASSFALMNQSLARGQWHFVVVGLQAQNYTSADVTQVWINGQAHSYPSAGLGAPWAMQTTVTVGMTDPWRAGDEVGIGTQLMSARISDNSSVAAVAACLSSCGHGVILDAAGATGTIALDWQPAAAAEMTVTFATNTTPADATLALQTLTWARTGRFPGVWARNASGVMLPCPNLTLHLRACDGLHISPWVTDAYTLDAAASSDVDFPDLSLWLTSELAQASTSYWERDGARQVLAQHTVHVVAEPGASNQLGVIVRVWCVDCGVAETLGLAPSVLDMDVVRVSNLTNHSIELLVPLEHAATALRAVTYAHSESELSTGRRQLDISIAYATATPNVESEASAALTVVWRHHNDFAPAFVSTSTIHVPENSPFGTNLLTLEASDGDGADSMFAFRLLPEADFSVVELLGPTLRLATERLDAETRASYSFVLEVSDGSLDEPSRQTKTTLTLHVTDVNDNAPRLVGPLKFAIPENSAPSTLVGVLQATDADVTLSNRLGAAPFALASGVNSSLPFSLDVATGELRVNGTLDYEASQEWAFTVRVTDAGQPSLTTSAVVHILVLDQNDHAPTLVGPAVSFVRAPETLPLNSTLLQLAASDLDSVSVSPLTFSSNSSVLAVDAETGRAYLATALDYEVQTHHFVRLSVSDGMASDAWDIVLLVLNANDNAPLWSVDHVTGHLLETDGRQAVRFSAGVVPRASDIDLSVANLSVVVHLEAAIARNGSQLPPAALPADLFAGLLASDGSLVLANMAPIDYEAITNFVLRIAITTRVAPYLSADLMADVLVEDANDHAPVPNATLYRFSVPERAGSVVPIGYLGATDADAGENARLSYAVEQVAGCPSPWLQQQFAMTSDGALISPVFLDYEACTTYSLLVRISDHGSPALSTLVRVLVTVTNINDNAPVLTNPNLSFRPFFEEAHCQFVAVLQPTDGDGDGVTLTAEAVDVSRPVFNVTGNVIRHSCEAPLDREVDGDEVLLRITVTDDGEPARHTSYDLVMPIYDINDNAPTLVVPAELFVAENLPAGTVVGHFNVSDADLDAAGEVTLSWAPSDALVFIAADGTIRTQRAFDREGGDDVFDITLNATDGDLPFHRTTRHIRVSVTDVNDNAPELRLPASTLRVAENLINVSLWTLVASDPDLNESFTFSLHANVTSVGGPHFKLHPTTGVLGLIQPLDYEQTHSVLLEVTVRDNAGHATQDTVLVLVDNLNDNTPYFSASALQLTLSETQTGAHILNLSDQVSVEDADGVLSDTTRLELVGNSTIFALDPRPPLRVTVNATLLDYEVAAQHVLTLRVSDSALSTTAPATTVLVLFVRDADDVPPRVWASELGPALVLTVQEDAVQAGLQPLAEVVVSGGDAGGAGRVAHFVEVVLEGIQDETEVLISSYNAFHWTPSTSHWVGRANVTTVAEAQDLVRDLMYVNTAVEPTAGTRMFVVRVGDAAGVASANVTLMVQGVNDRPVATRTAWVMSKIDEDTPLNNLSWHNVGMFAAVLGTDVDANGPLGLAILSATGPGHWQKAANSDGDGDGDLMPVPSAGAALLLGNETAFRFVPNDQEHGTATLSLRLWDGSRGVRGVADFDVASDLALADGSLSGEVVTVSLQIAPVPDAAVWRWADDNTTASGPSAAPPRQVLYTENGPVTRLLADVELYDYDHSASLALSSAPQVNVSLRPMYAGDRLFVDASVCAVETVARVNALRHDAHVSAELGDVPMACLRSLTFRSEAEEPTAGLRRLTLRTVNGGDGLDAELVVELSVVVVNDHAPVVNAFQQVFTFIEADESGAGSGDEEFEGGSGADDGLAAGVAPELRILAALEVHDDDVPQSDRYEAVLQLHQPPDGWWEGLRSGTSYNHTVRLEAVSLSELERQLRQVTYFNGETEPTPGLRRVTVQVTDEALTGSLTLLVRVNATNDNAPVFQGSSLLATMAERRPAGTLVTTLAAMDGDDDLLTFALHEPSNVPFQVSPDGRLLTTSVLNREARATYTLNVSAWDGRHVVFATMHIEVADVNDNAPRFGTELFELVVAENAPAGTVLVDTGTGDAVAPQVVDLDVGANAAITFSLLQLTPGTTLFRVNSTTGVISTTAALDYETRSSHVLVLMATDGGVPALSSDVQVIVQVQDRNDHAPVLASTTAFSVAENSVSVVGTLQATDADGDGLSFELVSVRPSTAAFQLLPNGTLFLTEGLDREAVAAYTLSCRVRDNGAPVLSTSFSAFVTVLDVNDDAPTLTGPGNLLLAEDTAQGSAVGTLQICDADIGANGRVRAVHVSSLTASGTPVLSVVLPSSTVPRPTSGCWSAALVLARELDYEVQQVHRLLLVAEDDGIISRASGPLDMTITVQDVNDSPPTLEANASHCFVPENAPAGVLPLALAVTDPDTGFVAANYVIALDATASTVVPAIMAEGSPVSLSAMAQAAVVARFGVSNWTLTTAGGLDREQVAQVRLILRVRDVRNGAESAAITVLVNVTDVDEFAAHLVMTEFDVPENAGVGTVIARLTVWDADASWALASRPAPTFSVVNATHGDVSVENTTGNLVVMQPLDTESRSWVRLWVQVNVVATDGPTEHQQSWVQRISVGITDVNERAQIVSPVTSVEVPASLPIGERAFTIVAEDEDLLWRHNVFVLSTVGPFNVSALTGEVWLMESLEAAGVSSFAAVVGVRDVDNAELTDLRSITIRVVAGNYLAPKLAPGLAGLVVREDSPLGAFVGTLEATDEDSDAAAVTFELIGNASALPDFETASSLNVTVRLTDAGRPPRSAEVTIPIRVEDVNEFAPTFVNGPNFYVQLYEGQGAATLVTVLTATDADGTAGALTFTLELPQADLPFEIYARENQLDVYVSRRVRLTDAATLTLYVSDGLYNSSAQLQIDVI
ncbi:uncharacterized protein MONBRDRAFT_29591 [Monosiga brevicollis MX1]|uniref:Cadherin domain-containing protein n=1 Tax=Monosiga brevicollis TaxID=81824 RepID=A9VBJ4_MONBE|nr:uncharacterized protein MONBRDRAFT_29591 [Monosiga brevicollis MX1]EDQ85109.1 predicted protein [Monosiga brevicollis MX1]|eukprot:XP_001750113.1 hypothetical protein [Monosiga brevicollis MX1]